MLKKKKTILARTLGVFIAYYTIGFILSYFLFVFVKKYLPNELPHSSELLRLIHILIIFVFLYCFNKKNKVIGGIRIKKIKPSLFPFLLLVLISALFFRIFVDPIIWIDKTFNFIEVPVDDNFIDDRSFISNILIFLGTVVITPIAEEIMFRGIIIKSLGNLTINYKILISSFLFSLAHFPIDINSLIIIFLLGIILSIIALKIGLIFAIIFHFIYNLIWLFLSIYPKEYWQLISSLEFNYIYWIVILIALLCLLLILKKIWINKINY